TTGFLVVAAVVVLTRTGDRRWKRTWRLLGGSLRLSSSTLQVIGDGGKQDRRAPPLFCGRRWRRQVVGRRDGGSQWCGCLCGDDGLAMGFSVVVGGGVVGAVLMVVWVGATLLLGDG
ncbi:hypothetical protein Dimus_010844, partial [Dionaea muscipula]